MVLSRKASKPRPGAPKPARRDGFSPGGDQAQDLFRGARATPDEIALLECGLLTRN